MYQLNEESYYLLQQLKNKVGFIRRISTTGRGVENIEVISVEQIATIFDEMEHQLDNILTGVEGTKLLQPLDESSS